MSSQGQTILNVRRTLKQGDGWAVAYVCVPNTPHIGVIPITTPEGSSEQRYPDVVATNGLVVRLIEVEIRLTEEVGTDILTRFREMSAALQSSQIWESWTQDVREVCDLSMPDTPHLSKELVLCKETPPFDGTVARELKSRDISITAGENFSP